MNIHSLTAIVAIPMIACATGCGKNRLSQEEISVVVEDSVAQQAENLIRIDTDFEAPVRSLDVFVFGTGDNASLERHCHDTSVFTTDDSPKTLCVILNSPYRFNDQAIPTLEALETLSIDFLDDDPSYPVASAAMDIIPEKDSVVSINPRKLMCEICLESVTNNLGGYRRLEDPVVYLLRASANAEPFRAKGFFPNSYLDTIQKKPLPCDVGIFTQYPQLPIYCYPNESASSATGTILVFECHSGNESFRCDKLLPPLCKGDVLNVSLIIDSSSEYYWNLSLNRLSLLD